ncbi:hypothetical protein D3C86_1697940 [compost metagenome]
MDGRLTKNHQLDLWEFASIARKASIHLAVYLIAIEPIEIRLGAVSARIATDPFHKNRETNHLLLPDD